MQCITATMAELPLTYMKRCYAIYNIYTNMSCSANIHCRFHIHAAQKMLGDSQNTLFLDNLTIANIL